MNQLWAPWRMTYIAAIDRKDEGCIFCTKHTDRDDRKNLVLYRGNKCYVIMNLFPYNNGHLLVIPYEHVPDICRLEKSASSELWDLLCLSRNALTSAFHPDGFNIGINIGRTAGAGIDSHAHAHIVPRWNGDTNFMSVLGDTKVISQALEETYDALAPYFRSIAGSSSGAAPAR